MDDCELTSKAREFHWHVIRLLKEFPDQCPKACEVMLSFMSCIADAGFVYHLVARRVLGTFRKKIFIDARKFHIVRMLLIDVYGDQLPRVLFHGFRGINLSLWPEMYREEQRKHDQATYASRIKISYQIRCSQLRHEFKRGQFSKSDGFARKVRKRSESRKKMLLGSLSAWLQLQEKPTWVIKLIDVKILSKGGLGGETTVGSLEVHGSEFLYISSSISTHFKFDNIGSAFFRLGDKRMPPLLHFHLRDPIMVGTEKAKDIQFHLVPCPLGQKRSDQDSDKFEKEKKFKSGDNEGLKNFVGEVRDRWKVQPKPPCPFEEIDQEYEFYGVLPSKASAGFALTSFSLIVLVETPFTVLPLRDIEIVHLALLRPGEIDLTVIFQDFKVDHVPESNSILQDKVLEINSIPVESLSDIKHCLNNGYVKYYVNSEKQDWKSIVQSMADSSKLKALDEWHCLKLKLEDYHTLAYYKETDIDPKCALEEC